MVKNSSSSSTIAAAATTTTNNNNNKYEYNLYMLAKKSKKSLGRKLNQMTAP